MNYQVLQEAIAMQVDKLPHTWAHLNDDTPFNQIFPSGTVPIESIFPIVPGKEGNPSSYVVDAKFLSEQQIQSLAILLFEQWPDCVNLEQAIAYVRDGLPLKTSWFYGCGTSNPGVFFTLMDGADDIDFNFEIEEDYDDYDEYQEDWKHYNHAS